MKVYLVGGAVRDQLLKLPVHEKDWVVVGTTPEQLLAQGFRQVGHDFPVFLHPKTKEEYALARLERKLGVGYYGFGCDFSPDVTLEQDLARRDLTINAMAMDESGGLIDPFNGQSDIENRVLRHVSAAFIEDPVRVLRVARFAARFYCLGFRLAEETRSLMYTMVRRGELDHLVPERVWKEWQLSLEEKNPEQFILTLRGCDGLRVILPEMNALFGVPNPFKYHSEIDSGVHSLLVLEAATQLSADPQLRFAALVHDLGKAISPMSNWPKHFNHEENGVSLIENLCARLRIPNDFKSLAVLVARHHLKIHRLFELCPKTIVGTLEQTDAFRRPQLFQQLLLACQADAQGCGKTVEYKPAKYWVYLLAECNKINSRDIIERGYEGKQIKEALHHHRVARVKLLLNSGILNER